jgi:hypothetical protein
LYKQAQIILYCAPCRASGYCGKECQINAWLEHKKLCSSNSANNIKRNDTTKFAMVLAFLNDTYIEIMTELPKVTQEHGVTMKDVVLQFHFFSNATNPGPATIGEFA